MNRNRYALRRIPTTLLALRNAAYQATPSRRDATMMTLLPGQILGFPPVCGGAWERGIPGALQEGMAAPVGVTASVSAIRQGFLPTPKKPRPQCSNALHQTRRPPTHATTILQSPPPSHQDQHSEIDRNGRDSRERGLAKQRTRRRARPPPPKAVTDRTPQQKQTRPFWPGRARGLVKLPSPRCSKHVAVQTITGPSHSSDHRR
jgi:hypothetical protein